MKRFELQRLVEGVELSTEGWFDGEKWLEPFNSTFEEKKLMTGGLGPNVGCAGNIVIAHREKGSRIVRETLKKMTQTLARQRYIGPLDINCIVNGEGAFGLEFTPRFGYDAIQALSELLSDDFGKLLHGLATGQLAELPVKRGVYAGALRVSVPPYPEERGRVAGIPVRGLSRADKRHTHLGDVRISENGSLVTAGSDGVVAVFTGSGSTPLSAMSKPYELAERVKLPNKQYRLDIGRRVEDDERKLSEWGYTL